MGNLLLNRYEIVQSLGSGGFGETFLAKDTQIPSQRLVVVKQLKPANEQNHTSTELIEKLFQKEAAVLEELGNDHSQIPKLYGYVSENDEFYLVQEYIKGVSLSKAGKITSEQAKTILSSLLNTLKYIHSKGIIHRDIKPENIILRDGDKLPVLIDFGAVKETMGTVTLGSGSTVSSVVIGTRGFMAPEQSAGRSMFSTDLYALGLTIIYAITQKLPVEFATSQLTGELDWESDAPNINPGLVKVLDKAIQMELSRRYSTAEEMYKDLESNNQSHPKTAPTLVIAPSATSTDSNIFTESTQIIGTSSSNSNSSGSKWIPIASGIGLMMASIIILGGLWTVRKVEESANHQAEIKAMEAELEKKDAEYKQQQAEQKMAEAEKILEDNKKRQADLLEQEKLNREIEAEKKRLENERITLAASNQEVEPVQSPNSPQSNQVTISNGIVYIHYKNDGILAQELQDYLMNRGISIGDVAEQVDGIKRNDIRYSRPSSKQLAMGVKNEVEQFYRERGMDKSLSMIDLSTRGFNTSENNLEIWITD